MTEKAKFWVLLVILILSIVLAVVLNSSYSRFLG